MEWFITSIDSDNYFDLSQLRLMGVMQRLGICYGITALLAVTIPHKRFMPLAIILLAVYFIFQLFGNGFEKSADNIVGMIDSAILVYFIFSVFVPIVTYVSNFLFFSDTFTEIFF